MAINHTPDPESVNISVKAINESARKIAELLDDSGFEADPLTISGMFALAVQALLGNGLSKDMLIEMLHVFDPNTSEAELDMLAAQSQFIHDNRSTIKH